MTRKKIAHCDICRKPQLACAMRAYWCGHRLCKRCKRDNYCHVLKCPGNTHASMSQQCANCCTKVPRQNLKDVFGCKHFLCSICRTTAQVCTVVGCNGLLLAPEPSPFQDFKDKFRVVKGTNVLATPCKCPLCLPVFHFTFVYASTLWQHLLEDHAIAQHVVEKYFGV